MADVNLVLEKFEFSPDAAHTLVELRGKMVGFMGFWVRRLGLAPDAYLIITRDEVQFKFVRFSGMTIVVCPLATVTSVACGLRKPLWALYLGLAFLFALPTLILPLIGVGLLLYFARTQFLTFTFSTSDLLQIHGLNFAAVTDAGKQITVSDVLNIVTYVNSLLQPKAESVNVSHLALASQSPAKTAILETPPSTAQAITEPPLPAETVEILSTMPNIESIMEMEQAANLSMDTSGIYLIPDDADDVASPRPTKLQDELLDEPRPELILYGEVIQELTDAIPDDLMPEVNAADAIPDDLVPEVNAADAVPDDLMPEVNTADAIPDDLEPEMNAELPAAELELSVVSATPSLFDAAPALEPTTDADAQSLLEATLVLPDDAEVEDIDAELAALFGETPPDPIPPVMPLEFAAAATLSEDPLEPYVDVPVTGDIPASLSASAEPTQSAVLPDAQAQLSDTKPKKPAAATTPGTPDQLIDTKPKKPTTAETPPSKMGDTKSKKPAPSAMPYTETPASAIFKKSAPGNPEAWQTGEMRAVLPTSGATGTLDLDKQISRQKLREGFDLFQKKKYMDALVALKEAQTLDPDNPKVKEGIQACEQRLRRQ